MTREVFNAKWKAYIEEGFEDQGLEFSIPSVTKFLDYIFTDLVWIPGFKYSQIKLKFGMARFYTNLGMELNNLIEAKIDHLVAKHDAEIAAAKLKENG